MHTLEGEIAAGAVSLIDWRFCKDFRGFCLTISACVFNELMSQVVWFAAFLFRTDPFPLTCRVGTCAAPLAHLWESRWWGHLRACLLARDESCSRQSGRSLFADSFPSGLWIRLAVHGEPGLAGKDRTALLESAPP